MPTTGVLWRFAAGATTGGIAFADHLWTLAGICMTGAFGVLIALAPQIWQRTAKARHRRHTVKQTDEQKTAYIEQLESDLTEARSSRDRWRDLAQSRDEELKEATKERHRLADELQVARALLVKPDLEARRRSRG